MLQYPIHKFSLGQQIGNTPESLCLWMIEDPPEALYVQGSPRALERLDELPGLGLAIVGTRHPQARSVQFVEKTVRSLAGQRIIILSGLALGIDATAHRSALKFRIPTIAVLGGSLDQLYPRENIGLAEQILRSDGLLVSEFPPGTPPKPSSFILRNRIIAQWSKAVWVAEAGQQSGALNTAKWARESKKEVLCFATPGFPGDPALIGNQSLIDDHEAKLFWGAHSLGEVWIPFSELNPKRQRRRGRRSERTQLSLPQGAGVDLGNELVLAERVRALTFQSGGAQVSELLEWAVEAGWSPPSFFLLLQSAVSSGLVEESRVVPGVFVTRS